MSHYLTQPVGDKFCSAKFLCSKIFCSPEPYIPQAKISKPGQLITHHYTTVPRYRRYFNLKFKWFENFKPNKNKNIIVFKFGITGRFLTGSYAVVHACTKLAHFSLEKRLHETETSKNFVGSVKRSSVHFSIKNWRWNICQITRTLTIKKIKGPNFTNFTIFWLWERIEDRD